MKQANNIITYYWNGDGNKPDGLRSTLCKRLIDRGTVKPHDMWTILNRENVPCGAFVHVTGAKWLVDGLAWLTNLSFHKGDKKAHLTTNETGQITGCEELS